MSIQQVQDIKVYKSGAWHSVDKVKIDKDAAWRNMNAIAKGGVWYQKIQQTLTNVYVINIGNTKSEYPGFTTAIQRFTNQQLPEADYAFNLTKANVMLWGSLDLPVLFNLYRGTEEGELVHSVTTHMTGAGGNWDFVLPNIQCSPNELFTIKLTASGNVGTALLDGDYVCI